MKKIFVGSVFIAIIFSVFYGCISYKRVNLSNGEPFVNEKIKDNFERYNIYIHDGLNIFKVQNPSLSENIISGEAICITSQDEIKTINETSQIIGKNKHKYDLNIYTKKPLNNNTDSLEVQNDEVIFLNNSMLASSDSSIISVGNKFKLKENEIEKIEMFALNEKSVGNVVLGIVLGCLLIGLTIWWIIIMATEGSNGSADASGKSSDNSNSNSNSGGSCYIATMVYGSYDAPEVLVLRKFRDNFLLKCIIGRKFVKLYYKFSPLFVEKFKHNKTIHKPIRYLLNNVVKFLSQQYSEKK